LANDACLTAILLNANFRTTDYALYFVARWDAKVTVVPIHVPEAVSNNPMASEHF
jgi:hypothetical protein